MDNRELAESLVADIINEDATAKIYKQHYDDAKAKYDRVNKDWKKLESLGLERRSELRDEAKKDMESRKPSTSYHVVPDKSKKLFPYKISKQETFRRGGTSNIQSMKSKLKSLLIKIGMIDVTVDSTIRAENTLSAEGKLNGIGMHIYIDLNDGSILIGSENDPMQIASHQPEEFFSAPAAKELKVFAKSMIVNDRINKNTERFNKENPDKKSTQHEAASVIGAMIYSDNE